MSGSRVGQVGVTAAALEREADVLRAGVTLIVDRLPSGWRADVAEQVKVDPGGKRADAVMELMASDGTRAVLVLEAKRSMVVRDAPTVLSQLETISGHLAGSTGSAVDVVPVVVARYLAPSVRKWL